MYGYLEKAYRENDLSIEEWQRRHLMADMAADGTWRPFFDFIAETLRRFSSQRDKQRAKPTSTASRWRRPASQTFISLSVSSTRELVAAMPTSTYSRASVSIPTSPTATSWS